jgi:hypothetical protein
MRVLILGDVVGRPARRAIRDLVPSLIEREERQRTPLFRIGCPHFGKSHLEEEGNLPVYG